MMHKYRLVQGAWLSLAVVLGVTITSPAITAAVTANEQNPNGAFSLVVSPPSLALQTTPGKATTSELRIQNQGIATERVKVSLMKFSAYGEDGRPDLKDVEPSDDFAKWITFSSTRFEAEPRVWKTVNVTINPPASAAFGYYYAVVFSRDGAASNVNNQSNLLGAAASLVLLDVNAPGSLRRSQIAEFSTPNKVQELLPVVFTVRMKNDGNTHVAPRGNIFITRGGKQVATLEVNLKKGYVLPGSTRMFTADWADGSPVRITKTENGKTVLDTNNKPVVEVSYDKLGLKKLRIGKYQAKLVMVHNDGKSDIANEAYLSFWVMPWRVIAGITLGVIIFLAGLWALFVAPLRRRLKQKSGHARKP